jgi:hypothetical protein
MYTQVWVWVLSVPSIGLWCFEIRRKVVMGETIPIYSTISELYQKQMRPARTGVKPVDTHKIPGRFLPSSREIFCPTHQCFLASPFFPLQHRILPSFFPLHAPTSILAALGHACGSFQDELEWYMYDKPGGEDPVQHGARAPAHARGCEQLPRR